MRVRSSRDWHVRTIHFYGERHLRLQRVWLSFQSAYFRGHYEFQTRELIRFFLYKFTQNFAYDKAPLEIHGRCYPSTNSYGCYKRYLFFLIHRSDLLRIVWEYTVWGDIVWIAAWIFGLEKYVFTKPQLPFSIATGKIRQNLSSDHTTTPAVECFIICRMTHPRGARNLWLSCQAQKRGYRSKVYRATLTPNKSFGRNLRLK